MSDGGLIFEKIPAIMAEVGAIAKDQEGYGFAYRGIDQFMNVLHPILVRHEVFIAPEVERVEYTYNDKIKTPFHTRAVMRYTLYTTDGSSVSCSVCAEGLDNADKASNKVNSFGWKYAAMQIFSIPTEDMAEGDSETPDTSAVEDEADAVIASQVAQIRTALADNGTQESVAEDYLRSIGKLREGMTLADISTTFGATITGDEGALVRMIEAIDDYKANVDAELNNRAAE